MKSAKAAAKPSTASPAYKNPKLPSQKRVDDLLKRMTLEEKAAQMMCIWQEKAKTMVDEKGDFEGFVFHDHQESLGRVRHCFFDLEDFVESDHP